MGGYTRSQPRIVYLFVIFEKLLLNCRAGISTSFRLTKHTIIISVLCPHTQTRTAEPIYTQRIFLLELFVIAFNAILLYIQYIYINRGPLEFLGGTKTPYAPLYSVSPKGEKIIKYLFREPNVYMSILLQRNVYLSKIYTHKYVWAFEGNCRNVRTHNRHKYTSKDVMVCSYTENRAHNKEMSARKSV